MDYHDLTEIQKDIMGRAYYAYLQNPHYPDGALELFAARVTLDALYMPELRAHFYDLVNYRKSLIYYAIDGMVFYYWLNEEGIALMKKAYPYVDEIQTIDMQRGVSSLCFRKNKNTDE